MGYRSYSQIASACDSIYTIAYTNDEKIIAIVALTSVKSNWSASFSFWLGPAYHRMHSRDFVEMIDRLREWLEKNLGLALIYTLCNNQHQINVAERLNGIRCGEITDLYGPNTVGVFYKWELRDGR